MHAHLRRSEKNDPDMAPELAQSEVKLRELLENNPADILIISPDYQIQFANHPWRGHTKEQLVGKNCLHLLDKEQAEHFERGFKQLFQSGEITEFDLTVEQRWYRYRLAPIKIKDKNVAAIVIATDITEHKANADALQASEEKYRFLFNSIGDPVLVVDRQSEKVLDCNPAASHLYGYEAAKLCSLRFRSLFAPEQPADGRHQAATRFKHWMARHRAKDGTIYDVEISEHPITYRNKPAVIYIIRDVSDRVRKELERQKLETQLYYAQKLESLGLLAGGIAHDFNNLLTGILGNASLALMEENISPPVIECLRDIEKAAQRAAALCQQMLAYSGKGKFVVEHIDISVLLKDLVRLIEITLSATVKLECEFASGLPPIEADGMQIRQVVMNLITNAAEAIGEAPGKITLRSGAGWFEASELENPYLFAKYESGEYVYLDVSDTGCGMTPETIEKIFDPFFTTKFTGRGLGLAAVLGIVRGHKGAIRITSEPGKGTTFRVLFPSSKQAGQPKPRTRHHARRTQRQTDRLILVVDDEPAVRKMCRRVLEHSGYGVLTATDGDSAVSMLEENLGQVKGIILDLTMPNTSTDAVLGRFQQLDAKIPVIITTGLTGADVEARLRKMQINGILQKPFTPDELLAAINLIDKDRTSTG